MWVRANRSILFIDGFAVAESADPDKRGLLGPLFCRTILVTENKRTIPSIKPDQADVASYRRNARVDPPKQSNFNGFLVFVIALMAIMMGVGGFVLYEVQQNLAISNQLLNQGQNNIRDLNTRISETGTDVLKTTQDLSDQVKLNFSEIDKLWKIAHRQNKPDIQKNLRDIALLKEKTALFEKNDSERLTKFDQALSKIDSLGARIKNENEELITEISFIKAQLEDQLLKREADKREFYAMEKKIEGLSEAINSIDQHRRIINQKLAQMRDDVQRIDAE